MNKWVLAAIAPWLFVPLGQTPAKTSRPPTPPIEYFSQHCQRCHGYLGENYGSEFGRNLTDVQLQKVVKEMTEGPGGAPLAGTDLAALIALHRALARKEPYIVVTELGPKSISGEVSPGTKVQAIVSGSKRSVNVKGTRWTVAIPGSQRSRLVLEATHGAKWSTLRLAEGLFTHGKAKN